MRVVDPPAEGVWRIGRGDDPLRHPAPSPINLGAVKAGNRFDSVTGSFGVLYFGTHLEACFGETLNRYRKDPALAFLHDEWETLGFMAQGSVPADWRTRRTIVQVTLDADAKFFDIESPTHHRLIEQELGSVLTMLGVDEVDVAVLRGPDRRVTRFISEWVWGQSDASGNPLVDGIRYLSRSNTDWECWAVYDDVVITERQRLPIARANHALQTVAKLYDLLVF